MFRPTIKNVFVSILIFVLIIIVSSQIGGYEDSPTNPGGIPGDYIKTYSTYGLPTFFHMSLDEKNREVPNINWIYLVLNLIESYIIGCLLSSLIFRNKIE